MASVFAPGSEVTLVFSFVDLNGAAVEPSELNLVVTDEDDEQVHATSVTLPGGDATSVTVTIPASANALASGSVGARRATLEMTVGTGVVPVTAEYVLRAATQLVVPTNSFQTYMRAVARASTLPGLVNWGLSSEADRIAALILAYNRLTRFVYRVWRPQEDDEQNRLVSEWDNVITTRMWPVMSGVEFAAYGEHFLEAIRNAQIVEAEQILSGDIARDKRDSGILSETVGESSMMFQPGKARPRVISSEARRYIASFIASRGVQIARA